MKKALVSAVFAGMALASTANADLLYSNAWDGLGPAYSSQNDVGGGNGNFATCYGFFTTGRELWSVEDIHFKGTYFNPNVQGPIFGFQVNIFADAGNAPGAFLGGTYVPSGSFTETFLGGDPFGNPAFQYDMNLNPTLVSGDAWVSIVPDLTFPPQWGWYTGVDANPLHAGWQVFFGSPARLPGSLNMDITGKVVPAPASFGLVGLAGIAAIRRRRA